jgi:hypothetical protein
MKFDRIPLIPLSGAGVLLALGTAGALYRRRSRRAPLDELTKDDLYERAQAADIPGRSGMTKDELVRALRSAA